jgi:YHS domain-containing protein
MFRFSLRTLMFVVAAGAAVCASGCFERKIPPANSSKSTTPVKSATADRAAADFLIGLEGYCPVTLHKKRVWRKGDPNLNSDFQGEIYHFLGPEELQKFRESPATYAPRFAGKDVVRMVDEGRESRGLRDFGVIYKSQIYLFDSAQTRDTFESSTENYASHE